MMILNISQVAHSIRLLCYAILLAAPDLLGKGAFQVAMNYVQERELMTVEQAELFRKMYIPGPNAKMTEEVFTTYYLPPSAARDDAEKNFPKRWTSSDSRTCLVCCSLEP